MLIILIMAIILVLSTGRVRANLKNNDLNSSMKIDFVEANLRDIIYTFAAVYDIDVYVYENVTGQASIKMSGEGSVDVLKDLVINSGYSWEKKNDILYIGGEKDIAHNKPEPFSARENWTVKTLNFQGAWEEKWSNMLDRFYPDVMRIINSQNNIIVLAGEKQVLTRKKNFIESIFPAEEDMDNRDQKLKTEIVNIPASGTWNLDFLEIFPGLKFRDFSESGYIYISGPADKVDAGIDVIEDYINKFEQKEKIVTLNYISTDKLQENLVIFEDRVKINYLDQSRLILGGNKNELNNVIKKINNLDIPQKQVMIEFEVWEFSQDKIENELNLNPPALSLEQETSKSIKYKLTWEDFFDAALETGEVELLSSARLSAIAGQPARIHFGEKFPLVIERDGEEDIEYLDSGIILQVVSEINENEEIELSIEPEVSTAEMTATGYPSFNTRKLVSSIRLNNGETFYLGGITRDQLQMTSEITPVLSSIPILGNLFSKEYMSEESTELIISVTPHLIEDNNSELQEIVR